MTLVEAVLFGLEVSGKIIKAVRDAMDGQITPEQLLARIGAAAQQDASVDARVDEAIAQKFSEEGE